MTMEKFSKYIGIQGVLVTMFVTGYIIASLLQITLSPEYVNMTFALIGYYTAKNGVGILDALKNVLSAKAGK